MDFICEDVQCLLSCKNVHIVLSTRRNESIPEDLREKFKVLRFQQITNERIRAYLHLKETDVARALEKSSRESNVLENVWKIILKTTGAGDSYYK